MDKIGLRNHFRAIRASFSERAYTELSQKINHRLIAYKDWSLVDTVHVFWPLVSRREPDIRPFIEHLFKQDVRVLLPVMSSFSNHSSDKKRMQQAELRSFRAHHQNKWGITEPDHDSFVPPDELDVAIVPALGVDHAGYRIGYGMGNYDEFLTGLTIPIVCPVFSSCVIEKAPHEPHDVRVATLITDRNTIETGGT